MRVLKKRPREINKKRICIKVYLMLRIYRIKSYTKKTYERGDLVIEEPLWNISSPLTLQVTLNGNSTILAKFIQNYLVSYFHLMYDISILFVEHSLERGS